MADEPAMSAVPAIAAAAGRIPAPGQDPSHAHARAQSHGPPTADFVTSSATGTASADRADVARVLAGDVEAFAVLVDRHQGRILGHLARLVGASDAEDLAQETFVRAYQALARFD